MFRRAGVRAYIMIFHYTGRMAFTTTQSIDSLLARGLNFRLPNNAPISSLYTLYANGQGQTYWSNSINPMNLSTLSTTIGRVESTTNVNFSSFSSIVEFQSTQISSLFAQDQQLSTDIYVLSNFLIEYVDSSIMAISTVSSFYYATSAVLSTTVIGLSTLSTTIGVQNTSTYTVLSTMIYATNTSSVSSFNAQFSSLSTQLAFWSTPTVYEALLSQSTQLNQAITSSTDGLISSIIITSNGIIDYVNLTSNTLNNDIAALQTQIVALLPPISTLVNLSTNLESTVNTWISTAFADANSTVQLQIDDIYSTISTVQYSTAVIIDQLQIISTNVFYNNAYLVSSVAANTSNISVLTYEYSVLTTSSLIAQIYNSFMDLEAYTSTLLGNTFSSLYMFESTLYSTITTTNYSISQAYFDYFTSTLYSSSLSTVLSTMYVFTSSMMSSMYSTGTYVIVSTMTSTAMGINASTIQSSINGYISTPAGIFISTSQGTASTLLISFSTSAGALLSTTTQEADATLSTIETSTIVAYNEFVSILAAQASTATLSTLYTQQTINLTNSNYVGTMDLNQYTNFYVNIYGLASNTNSSYMLNYNFSNASIYPYKNGIITLNVSTVGYAGSNHQFRFNLYPWGIPTTVWSNIYPSIMNYDYEAQYMYNIVNSMLYTNLLGVYPRLAVSRLTVTATPNVFASTVNAVLSTTYWQNTPISFSWSNYNSFANSNAFGGPDFNPLIAVDFFIGSTFYAEYSTYTFATSSATVVAPPLSNALQADMTARIYVVGKPLSGLTYNFKTVNRTFNSIQINNVAGSIGNRLLVGNELVVRTTTGLYPLKGLIPTVSVTGPNSYYFNDANYSLSNFTNGLLNTIGRSPSNAYIARTSVPPPPSGNNFFFYQTLDGQWPKFTFNINDTRISTFVALQNMIGYPLKYTVQTTTFTKSLTFFGDAVNNGSNYTITSVNTSASNVLFNQNNEACQIVVGYTLPTDNSLFNTTGQQNFIGGENSNFIINSTNTPAYANIIAYYPLTTNWNTSIGLINLTPTNASLVSSVGAVGTQSAYFNGTNGYASFPSNFPNNNQLTVAVWVYYLGGSAYQRVFDFGQDINYYAFFSPSIGGGAGQAGIVFNGLSYNLVVPALQTNIWTHVVVTFDKAASELRVYYNGAQVGIRSIPYSIGDVTGTNNNLGKSKFASDPYLNGYLEEFILWNTVLTAAQVSTLYGYQRTPYGGAETLTYNISLNPNDQFQEMAYYNLYGSQFGTTMPITGSNMAGNRMTLSMTVGNERYISTIIFTGAAVENYYLTF